MFTNRINLKLTLTRLLMVTLAALLGGVTVAQADSVSGSAPLGTATTATLTLDNSGQPAQTVTLFESLPGVPDLALADSMPLRVALPDIAGPLDPALADILAETPTGRGDIVVYFAAQADLSAAAQIADWNARGAAVVAALQAQAAKSQPALIAELEAAGYRVTPFWIVNAVLVEAADIALAEALAARHDVALVTANHVYALPVPVPGENEPASIVGSLAGGDVAWGVAKIAADRVWHDWGVTGAGIVVGAIDSGVYYQHAGLIGQYRGNLGGGVFAHDYNWFDPTGKYSAPADENGHGTHVMGTMVGNAWDTQPTVGVAPGAQWIAARGCESSSCSDVALIGAAQWMLAPTEVNGDNPRTDLRPHVINNSWGGPGESDWYDGYVTAWTAAGIFSNFAVGNYGALFGCESTITPGNSVGSFAVGATDSNDIAASFSSRGPTSDGRIKPEISAPGVNIPSAWPDGGLRELNGTSMATPHVSGVVALLWSANPALIGDLAGTQAILTSTALPLYSAQCSNGPTDRPNNVYGWGRLDAWAAVQTARVDVPWLSLPASVDLPASGSVDVPVALDARQVTAAGVYTARILVQGLGGMQSHDVTFTVTDNPDAVVLSGQLTDRWQGTGVYGKVNVQGGPQVWSDLNGDYAMTLLPGDYDLTYSATGYVSVARSLTLVGTTSEDVVLMLDAPHVSLTSAGPISASLNYAEQAQFQVTIENQGPQPLTVSADVPGHEYKVLNAGGGAPPLYDLSGVTPLTLGDDTFTSTPLDLGFYVPLFGGMVRQVYLSSNGWVSLTKPTWSVQFASCLPETRLPAYSIMPFWADLDPSAGGAVRAGQVDADTYVISFEQVPHWQRTPNPPNDPTYTFQLVFEADGTVSFLYGAMGAMPVNWAVGFQRSSTSAQQVACGRAALPLTDTVWAFRNQALSAVWLAGSPSLLTVAANSSETFTVTLSGYGFAPWYTEAFEAPLWLRTDDPLQPVVLIPTTLTLLNDAPYKYYYPIIGR